MQKFVRPMSIAKGHTQAMSLPISELPQAMGNPEDFPPIPTKLVETGLNIKFVSALLFRSIYLLGLETNVQIAAQLRLSQGIVDDLLNKLKQQGFIEIRGISASDSRVARYSLTNAAKD